MPVMASWHSLVHPLGWAYLNKIAAFMMIWPFKKASTPSDQVLAIYNAIVAQSRQKNFYAEWSVPDTVTGRFDMICLHMCLVFRRLRPAPGGNKDFAQDLFDLFFKDMDNSLREMSVNDVAIPKRIQKMGNLFYGLLDKVTTAIDANDAKALAVVINRNIYDETNAVDAKKLGRYLIDLATKLDTQSAQAIEAGEIDLGETS